MAVRRALRRPGAVGIHFQPIVDLARGVVAGYEALARFRGAPAAPDRWFAAAHLDGCGAELEARVLGTALRARSVLPPNTFLTLNVGPAAIPTDAVQEVFARAGDLRRVILEVTEQQEVADYPALEEALRPARERGALVAVDDAGAGFASLRHITQLRPDLVKVDRALVGEVDRDPVRSAVIEALGTFTSRLDAWLLAEGVETAGEVGRLMSLGVPLAQGYFLGRPAPSMGGLAPRAAGHHRRFVAARGADGDLASLSVPAATVRDTAAPEALLAAARAADRQADVVVVVDEFDRPVGLIAMAGRRMRDAPIMRVTAGDRVPDVTRRAMARPEAERFDPVASCDERGRLVGLIGVDRMVERLAGLADAAADRGAQAPRQRDGGTTAFVAG